MTTIDLRSDTVTRPSAAMREAIAAAEVGDDVLVEDPTVLRLEHRMAERLGKEAALFVPSGTMGNQLALRAQSSPGDQLICHADSHIYRYEAGAGAALSGLWPTAIVTEDGAMPVGEVLEALNPDDVHCAPPAILCLENTHNRCGGRVLDQDGVDELIALAHERSLRVHLDGARLWNASIANGLDLDRLAAGADSVSLCFSKGMGAPVGSVLVSEREVIARARRLRKQWGGGMRQVGVLAAACLFALDHNFQRLGEDHRNARLIAEELHHPRLSLAFAPESNIVLYDVVGDLESTPLADRFRELGVLVSSFGPRRIRLVTHLDVSTEACRQAVETLNRSAA